MIYTSDLLSPADMHTIVQKTGMGVESIDFSISDNLDQMDVKIREYRSYMNYIGITELTLHGPFLDLNPIAFDSGIRAASRYRFAQVYDAAIELGAKKIIFHTGFIPYVMFLEGWSNRMADFWNDYMETRKEVQILIENVLDPYPEPVKRVKRLVKAPNFKLCLDIGHANCYSEKSVENWVACYGNDIGHVHIHNNDGTKDSHNALDKGTISAKNVIDEIKKKAPEATYTIECNSLEDVMRSYEVCKMR